MALTAQIFTLDMVFDEYIALVRPLQSKGMIRTKEEYYKKHVSPKFGHCPVHTITYPEFQKFFNFMLSDKSPEILGELKKLMRNVYDEAYSLGMSEEYLQRVYRAILSYEEPVYRAMFMFVLQGRQLDEVLSICWEEVDFEGGKYTILSGRKGEGGISYEMSFRLYRVLRDHASGQEVLRGRVFPSPGNGKKFKNIGKAWRAILENAGIEQPMRLDDMHDMIGFYATNFLQLPGEKVSSALGRTDIK